MENPKVNGRLDLSKERYDQSTFLGRYKHFFSICNPLTLFNSDETLQKAKDIVLRYKKGENVNLSDEEIWKQKAIFDSAFHPVTETKMNPIARMSAQCPINALIMGGMLIFYKTRNQVLLMSWVNQSFNAIVNTLNASDPRFEWSEMAKTYGMAVGCALPVSFLLNYYAAKMGGRLALRLVPFFSISLANAINIPICRQKELKEGIQLWYEQTEIAKSQRMAVLGISSVVVSRVSMQLPHLLFLPIAMNKLHPFFKKRPKLANPFQLFVCALFLLFSTPFGCSLFPHKMHVSVTSLEPEVQEEIKQKSGRPPATTVYFNKGL